MHAMPADFLEAEPVGFIDLRDLLGLEAHILRALAKEKDDPEAEPRDGPAADSFLNDCAD